MPATPFQIRLAPEKIEELRTCSYGRNYKPKKIREKNK
jgi:hypothetical protein